MAYAVEKENGGEQLSSPEGDAENETDDSLSTSQPANAQPTFQVYNWYHPAILIYRLMSRKFKLCVHELREIRIITTYVYSIWFCVQELIAQQLIEKKQKQEEYNEQQKAILRVSAWRHCLAIGLEGRVSAWRHCYM